MIDVGAKIGDSAVVQSIQNGASVVGTKVKTGVVSVGSKVKTFTRKTKRLDDEDDKFIVHPGKTQKKKPYNAKDEKNGDDFV